ncbi:MAG: hypothetical protein M4579_003172 [Chaenotheca gracillima]|nr:MAG: hypothetical protein M4579_003172 [Chaenotheca gracillima]
MSSSLFDLQVHVVPCQHIREYPAGTHDNQEETLHVELKQYRPLNNLNPKPGDLTIVASPANGFPKELYEPLWDEILHRATRSGFAIRGIWIADPAHQGASGVLNENKVGNDPSWFDHSRDLLHCINVFRDQMPRPLVGIGHSMGGTELTQLALYHPRLFTSLVLMDPVIMRNSDLNPSPSPPQASSYRRDFWPSRTEAEASFRKSKFYQRWDSRVLERWLQYGLRDLPTAIYPLKDGNDSANGERPVTLTTTKHQEVMTFLRRNWQGKDPATGKTIINRDTHADVDPDSPGIFPFYRPEPIMVYKNLCHVRPSVLYIFGATSHLSTPKLCAEKMAETGVGVGGSGGAKLGRVQQVTLPNIGHLVAMDAVVDCADHAATWLGGEVSRWKTQEAEFNEKWGKVDPLEKVTVSEEWMQRLGGDPRLMAKNAAKGKL